jgi:hypothetical protein
MANHTINLTDTQEKALEYAAADVQEWITNAATNRARIAIEEIIRLNTDHCNENSIAIAVGRDAQVDQAFDLGIVEKASEKNAVEEK